MAAAFVAGALGRHVHTTYWPRDPTTSSGPAGAGGAVRDPSGARIGGPFTLLDQDGRPVTERDFRGSFLLIYFGYTYCPDVCPTELLVMSEVLDGLGDLADRIRPIFITIDPARDSVAVMKEYVANFHPRLVGLTGSEAQIAAVAEAYGVYYAKVQRHDGADDADYLVNHSSYIYLMDPSGAFSRLFRAGTKPERMAERIRRVVTGQGAATTRVGSP